MATTCRRLIKLYYLGQKFNKISVYSVINLFWGIHMPILSFNDVLKKFRQESYSERDKGFRFEALMKKYLLIAPQYKSILKNVWLWHEFPYRRDFSGKDTGIDLVAQTTGGDYWAIQCKCYDEDSRIEKAGVDSFLATSSKSFQNENLQRTQFTQRVWISTTNNWSEEAEKVIQNQNPPVFRISLTDLQNSSDYINWDELVNNNTKASLKEKKTPRPHQIQAINAFHEHFKEENRGKLIMACGTGKTFTSLKIAEEETNSEGTILFLVPSIALLGQTLREWSSQSDKPIYPICICSDTTVGKDKDDDISVVELIYPASTNVKSIVTQFTLAKQNHKGMIVVFSTYQSIDVISKAQKELNKISKDNCIFDLIICDEAHRTTGVVLPGKEEEEKVFTKVHDDKWVEAKKRLYMTATPRLYTESSKQKAEETGAILCSMDDELTYGKEVYRIGFGEAVEKNLLSDYKVLVLTLMEEQIPPALKRIISPFTNNKKEISTDDINKLIGCINALSKRVTDADKAFNEDTSPMRKAVAFCPTIQASKKITNIFNEHKDTYYNSLPKEEREKLVGIESKHIDGSMGASKRDELLTWLKNAPEDTKECRILTNVKCLSEGVDVPSLDAVMFLAAKNSQVDVVQSVGRVMRVADGKKYGYIIIPILIPAGVKPEDALDDNKTYSVIWTVLNALRAHDDRFDAEINKINLNKNKGTRIQVVGIADKTRKTDTDSTTGAPQELTLPFEELHDLQNVIYAKMVQKVGNKRYWVQWAQDVAKIAERYVVRINNLIEKEGKHKTAFNRFWQGLKKNINPAVTKEEVVQMLAQHLITQPVFEALFENYSFVQNNPVSKSLQKMIDLLEEQSMVEDRQVLNKFYDSVKERVTGIDNAEGRQKIIVELYDKFFKTAFPKVVEKLGIVYTPIEVVDFINNSVAHVLKKEFNRSLSDENVHILDPFTGTGTFIVRLIQTGLIKKEALARKYSHELHANEIVLLAYYIASINIENAYHDILGANAQYKPFDGICLTDTFQLGETNEADELFSDMLPQNSKRVMAQQKLPVRVIIGNPPYSAAAKKAGENTQNQHYPHLEMRINRTYVNTNSTNNNKIYDSYIKAFRWSSDRLDNEHGGIVAFVSNGQWLDNTSFDGFRACLEREFSTIYVFNLRGNQRTVGEISRKEGGKIFGSGSRTTIAITILVKKPTKQENEKATIYYYEVDDYMTREEKLALLAQYKSINNAKIPLKVLKPNEHNDWLNQRSDLFGSYIPMKADNDNGFFYFNSLGIQASGDNYCYNSSINTLREIVSLKFSEWNEEKVLEVIYRPFFKQYFQRVRKCIYRNGKWEKLEVGLENKYICLTGLGGTKDFSSLLTQGITDYQLQQNGQCFPLYYYEKNEHAQASLFDMDKEEYIRRDGITDFILDQCRQRYGARVVKEDIFYYVYGILHSPDYRTQFSADLKKMLPRIPLVDIPNDFWAFSKAGRELAKLHLDYENALAYPDVKVTGEESGKFNVEKLMFGKKGGEIDKTTLIYNSHIKITNIPLEAYEYMVNGRSAIEWIMDRYQVKVDKDSGIKNDPNDWAKEHNNPRYILDLILSIITVSMETNKIVKSLPKLEFK